MMEPKNIQAAGLSNHMHSSNDDSSAVERSSGRPIRRRSHRPRGCRGGSNRRKNKHGENRNRNNASKPMKTGTTKKQESFKTSRPAYNNTTSAKKHTWPLAKEVSSGNMLRGRENCVNNSSYSTSSEVDFQDVILESGSNSSSELSYGTDILPSFSESSSEEGIPNPATLSSNREIGKEYILPPLPSSTFQRFQPAAPRGPNPYALQPSTQHNNFQGQQPYPQLSQKEEASIRGRNENSSHGLVTYQPFPWSDFNAQRLSKQRQPVSGGSLFCTSPRSFLMGKTTTATRTK